MNAESHQVMSGEDHKPPRPTMVASRSAPLTRFLKATELDTRMLGMIGAVPVLYALAILLQRGSPTTKLAR